MNNFPFFKFILTKNRKVNPGNIDIHFIKTAHKTHRRDLAFNTVFTRDYFEIPCANESPGTVLQGGKQLNKFRSDHDILSKQCCCIIIDRGVINFFCGTLLYDFTLMHNYNFICP